MFFGVKQPSLISTGDFVMPEKLSITPERHRLVKVDAMPNDHSPDYSGVSSSDKVFEVFSKPGMD